MKLYKFYWDCGRMGSLEGLFFANPEDIPYGENIYFGEVLGKHSDISETLCEEDIVEIDLPEEIVTLLFEKLGRNVSGYNPIDYYHGEE